MLRAQALKAARARSKAAAKAAKAAAEAAANSGSPDVIVTNTNNNDVGAEANPEVDKLTLAHQRAIATVATLIQVHTLKLASHLFVTSDDPDPLIFLTLFILLPRR